MKQASPQLENGYTRIANELLEAIIEYSFTMSEYKIILLVFRMTYGWNRKEALISYGKITSYTKLDKRYAKKMIKKLVQDRVLFKNSIRGKNVLGLNKNYYTWRLWITKENSILKDTSGVFLETPYRCLPLHPLIIRERKLKK